MPWLGKVVFIQTRAGWEQSSTRVQAPLPALRPQEKYPNHGTHASHSERDSET